MLKKLTKQSYRALRRAFQTEDSRFIAVTGLKVSSISLGINLFVYYFLFQIIRLNYAFFTAYGFPEFMEGSPFYDYVIQEALENLTLLFMFHIFLFFIGVYVGWIILRPFRIIGEYSEKVIESPNTVYRVDYFSTYVLLTGFSEFFFEYLREARKEGEIRSHSIPPQFSRIHKPVFDKLFMLHFGLLLIIVAISSAVFIIENSSAVFENMVKLAMKTLPDTISMNKFFSGQEFILDEVVFLTITLIVLCYVVLGVHLYSKVSGAAFGIFSTMRAFMKGKHDSRVHLVGYAYVREYTRKLNKYLDHVQNNLTKQRPPS